MEDHIVKRRPGKGFMFMRLINPARAEVLDRDVNMTLWKYRAQYLPARDAFIIIKCLST